MIYNLKKLNKSMKVVSVMTFTNIEEASKLIKGLKEPILEKGFCFQLDVLNDSHQLIMQTAPKQPISPLLLYSFIGPIVEETSNSKFIQEIQITSRFKDGSIYLDNVYTVGESEELEYILYKILEEGKQYARDLKILDTTMIFRYRTGAVEKLQFNNLYVYGNIRDFFTILVNNSEFLRVSDRNLVGWNLEIIISDKSSIKRFSKLIDFGSISSIIDFIISLRLDISVEHLLTAKLWHYNTLYKCDTMYLKNPRKLTKHSKDNILKFVNNVIKIKR